MFEMATPILVATLIWWMSTSVLLRLVSSTAVYKKSAAVLITMLTILSTVGIGLLRDQDTLFGAYAGFFLGIMLWAWHEAMFLFGYVSGPRKDECPPGITTFERFHLSSQALLHHELLIIFHGILIVVLSMGADNQVAAATFLLLWIMRISSKLLIFFGAPNVPDALLPRQLLYLTTYFNRKHTTYLFPIFLCFTVCVTIWLGGQAMTFSAGSFSATAYILLATLSALAVFEHLALVIPLPDKHLWKWATKSTTTAQSKTETNRVNYGRT